MKKIENIILAASAIALASVLTGCVGLSVQRETVKADGSRETVSIRGKAIFAETAFQGLRYSVDDASSNETARVTRELGIEKYERSHTNAAAGIKATGGAVGSMIGEAAKTAVGSP